MRRAARLAFVGLLLAAIATPHAIENHDCPRAEQHLSQIINEQTYGLTHRPVHGARSLQASDRRRTRG